MLIYNDQGWYTLSILNTSCCCKDQRHNVPLCPFWTSPIVSQCIIEDLSLYASEVMMSLSTITWHARLQIHNAPTNSVHTCLHCGAILVLWLWRMCVSVLSATTQHRENLCMWALYEGRLLQRIEKPIISNSQWVISSSELVLKCIFGQQIFFDIWKRYISVLNLLHQHSEKKITYK